MTRLFVAIDLPTELASKLEQLRDAALNARWTPPDQYHITLKFIGKVGDELVSEITSLLNTVRAGAFHVEIAGITVFPGLRSPRVLVATVRPSEPLSDLQQSVESRLAQIGIEPERRAFNPHLTVGRLREVRPQDVRSYLQQHTEFGLESFPVTDFHLYESELTRSGAIHTRLATYELT